MSLLGPRPISDIDIGPRIGNATALRLKYGIGADFIFPCYTHNTEVGYVIKNYIICFFSCEIQQPMPMFMSQKGAEF